MPLGKSGKHYYSPHEMRRQGDELGDVHGKPEAEHPGQPEAGQEGADGDGNHHHEIHMHEDGTAHSVHTHPDGHQDEAEHGSYQEASDHMDAMMKPEEDQEAAEEDRERDEAEGEDLAGSYTGDSE